jgi:PAS domain S-box-containing protein
MLHSCHVAGIARYGGQPANRGPEKRMRREWERFAEDLPRGLVPRPVIIKLPPISKDTLLESSPPAASRTPGNQALIDAAFPLLRWLSNHLGPVPHAAFVTDDEGRVLDVTPKTPTAGTGPTTSDETRRNQKPPSRVEIATVAVGNCLPSVAFSEDDGKGEGLPVCLAVPVLGRSGRVMGTLGMWANVVIPPESLTTLLHLAHLLEERLAQRQDRDETLFPPSGGPDSPRTSAGLSGSILNVCQHPATRFFRSSLLRGRGFEVMEAASAEEAYQLLARKPDLALIDVNLSGMSGLDLTRVIKASDSTSLIPVLQVSSLAEDPTLRARVIDSGADGLLTEPLDTVELATAAEALLRARKLQVGKLDLHRSLAVQHSIAQTLTSGVGTEETTCKVLHAAAEHLEWDVAELWQMDLPSGMLKRRQSWHVGSFFSREFDARSTNQTFPPGTDLAGRVWLTGRTLWVQDLEASASFARSAAALELDLRSAAASPVRVGARVCGVLCFFGRGVRRAPDGIADLMESLAAQLGLFLERRKAEEALHASEREFRVAQELAFDGFVILRPVRDVQGNVVDFEWNYVNPSAGAILRRRPEELVGRRMLSVFPQRKDSGLFERYVRVLETQTPHDMEILDHSDGTIRWFRNTAVRLGDGVAVSFQDITPQKEAEEEHARLLTRERTARAEAEAARRRSTLVAEVSSALSSLNYSIALERVARIAVPSFADLCVIRLIGDDHAKQTVFAHVDPTKEILLKELASHAGFADRHEFSRVAMKGAEPIFFPEIPDGLLERVSESPDQLAMLRRLGLRSGIVVPLRSGPRCHGVVCFGRGIAESRYRYARADLDVAEELARRIAVAVENAELYRRAQDANRLKDEFLATLSHELRTPLNAILGWAQILLGRRMDEAAVRRGLETIARNARTQVRLIEDVLDVSRIITGKLRLEGRRIDPALVVQAAHDSLKPTAEARRIRLVLDMAPQPLLVYADPDRMQQVVWNLLSNALKFTPEGGLVTLKLTKDAGMAVIEVRDTGMGIPPSFLPYVFDRFSQADASSTRKFTGLGLGLGLVRHLTELHGGTVTASSPGEGKGATFIVRMPVLPAAPTEARSPDAHVNKPAVTQAAPSAVDLSGLRILVVDDDAATREVLLEMLGHAGAEVVQSTSAPEAMEILESFPCDLLIADIAMPEEDGYSLIRKVRSLPSEQMAVLPAIALTAYALERNKHEALAAGFTMHMSKPLSASRLLEAIVALMPDSRRRAAL